jgi:hypothetical protein
MVLSFRRAYEAALKAENDSNKNNISDDCISEISSPDSISPSRPNSQGDYSSEKLYSLPTDEAHKPISNILAEKTKPTGVQRIDNSRKSVNEDMQQRKGLRINFNTLSTRKSPPRYNPPPDLRPKPEPPAKQQKSEVRVEYSGDARLAWKPLQRSENLLLQFDEQLGSNTSVPGGKKHTPREVVLGIDFGTSCTKVVIGDRSLKQAYAVPFLNTTGISSYLLPCHLSEDGEFYTLGEKGFLHNDLKLSLLASPADPVKCARVCAYLALVIRASRSWLFHERQQQYIQSDIVWSLAIGQPADQATSSQSAKLFKKLGEVAWALAGSRGGITNEQCLSAWSLPVTANSDSEEVEILVMPELAAQIHGFVGSEQFDPRQPNVYLMVDVGAGTVDASVFRVKKTSGGTTSFNFFTNAVEAYGVVNLHRYRTRWWQTHLSLSPHGKAVVSELEAVRLPTEYRGHFPASYTEYVDGVDVHLVGDAKSPDEEFFHHVLNQVAGKVLYKTKKENLLAPQSITGMPFFLCGGGSRHNFYNKLKTELKKTPNCSWLNAIHRELTLPNNLRADGVSGGDYDRLSVAYGLSQLNIGTVQQVEAMAPSIPIMRESNWFDSYIDKDNC